MAIIVKNTGDLAKNISVKVLVYGLPGAGKTRLCATAPSPVVLSSESGLLSIRGENLPYVEIKTLQDLRDAYAWTVNSEEAKQYKTICLDSISEIAEQVLSEEKGKRSDGRAAYGEMNDIVSRLLRSFRDIPDKNIYFSCKIDKIQTETGAMIYGPSLPGKLLSQNIGYFFDEEFVLIKKANKEGIVETVLQTSSDTMYEAKDRSGSLDFYESPNLGNIFKKIGGNP